ncbi:MAG: hypothetical protein QQN41_11595 [Nitrosopumilus sp.]
MSEEFGLSIIKEKGKNWSLKAKSKNINMHEVIAIIRRYCDEVEKQFLDKAFKNFTFSIESSKDGEVLK